VEPPQSAARALDRALAEARLVALDVDGTLTDGRIGYLGTEELSVFDVHDGLGLVWLREAGVVVAWLSGRGSRAVERRARELGIRELHLGLKDKRRTLEELQRRLDIAPEHTVAMGDDFPDVAMAARAALFVAPANARPEVKARAGLVTRASGGAGAVRELVERLLAARGAWPPGSMASGVPIKAPGDHAPEEAE